MVTILTATVEQNSLKRGQEAGCNTALVPDAKLVSGLNQESLNKYSRHLSVLRENEQGFLKKKKKKISPSLCVTGCSFDLQADSAADWKGVAGGPGAGPHPRRGSLWSVMCPASPRPSEVEEVVRLSTTAVRLVPVDRREALGVLKVLCCQSSVQDMRVRPRLGKP